MFSKWIDPRSHRFCIVCMREKVFIYSEKKGHSVCKDCGESDALSLNNRRTIELVKRIYKRGYVEGFNESRPILSIEHLCSRCKRQCETLYPRDRRWYCIDCYHEIRRGEESDVRHEV